MQWGCHEWSQNRVSFPHSQYLGGISGDKGGYKGTLFVDAEGIGCGITGKRKGVVLWRDASGISYDSEQVAKSRVGTAMPIGVFALTASKSTPASATIAGALKDGGAAVYQVQGTPGPAVRGKIRTIVSTAGIPCLDDVPSNAGAQSSTGSPPAPLSVADELAKFVALRDSGALTSEEFSAQKAKLLES